MDSVCTYTTPKKGSVKSPQGTSMARSDAWVCAQGHWVRGHGRRLPKPEAAEGAAKTAAQTVEKAASIWLHRAQNGKRKSKNGHQPLPVSSLKLRSATPSRRGSASGLQRHRRGRSAPPSRHQCPCTPRESFRHAFILAAFNARGLEREVLAREGLAGLSAAHASARGWREFPDGSALTVPGRIVGCGPCSRAPVHSPPAAAAAHRTSGRP